MRDSLLVLCLLMTVSIYGQDCIGGAITTEEAYLYGRFETRMRSAAGSGVVSSFFMYNLDLNCNWPAENNEIDVEMTGNTEDLYFTTHYPGPTLHTDIYDVSFNPHLQFHDYAFEWEPGIVRWFIDGNLVNVQSQPFVADLIHPMRILMNLWAADAVSWVGPWDPTILPVTSEYEYVKCYAYTPGAGNYGTGNNFSHLWTDDFNNYDSNRWTVSESGSWDGNYCNFRSSSVNFSGGKMELTLQAPYTNTEFIPVTITVDMSDLNIPGSYFVNLSGNFNNWCGDCAMMTHQGGGIYTLTAGLPPGRNEFVISVNNWQFSSGPPLGSECDYDPCDMYANYGLDVISGSGPVVMDTFKYGACPDNTVKLDTEVILGACYESGTGLMRDDLRSLGLIPTTEPYTALGYNHIIGGGESIAPTVLSITGPDAIVDWVVLELRDKNIPTSIVETQSALLKRNGEIVDVDGNSSVTFSSTADQYYIAIRHRNHLGIMSASPISFSGPSSFLNFTAGNTFGSNAQSGATPFLMWPGDGNMDGQVVYQGSSSDLLPITSAVYTNPANTNFQATFPYLSYASGDYNMDGSVIYQGSGSDIVRITQTVYTHPANTSFQATYPISAQLP